MSAQQADAEFIVAPGFAGERVDVFLSQATGTISRSSIQRSIADGAVLVNGLPAKKNCRVAAGDRVHMARVHQDDRSLAPEPQDIPLSILYEDEWILAVNKPAGLVVHPGNGNRSGTLVNALLFHLGRSISEGSLPERPGIVHRLDKDTSGVLLAAKTNEAHAALARAFASRRMQKTYLGFCMGVPAEPSGVIDVPLARSRKDPLKRSPDPRGKSSCTDYQLLAAKSGVSLVRFMPRTGRTHQIRVHCSSRGFPVLGDMLYGGALGRLQQLAPLNRPFAVKMLACFDRQALHAWKIGFTHPFLQSETVITAPLPDDFLKGLATMELSDPVLSDG
jgi:23S rRNA pseudouridine1911/1915/1917 synthase